ncbi:hypothetical protein RA210_U20459 [Rubrivivax sp. A210]|nr:hypothetical protein RA210_U20459 [Rubrivivax sp. A210]
MPSQPVDDNQASAAPMVPAGYRWLPMVDVHPGMVIARPVVGQSGVLQTMYLATGAAITEATIEQMVVKGVECVAVGGPPDCDEPEDDLAATRFGRRLDQIFGPSPSGSCLALRDALILARRVL